MDRNYPVIIHRKPELRNSALVVCWSEDAAKLGNRVGDFLVRKLGGREFGEIEPTDFFPLGGVAVEDDVAQFPEGKFYSCEERNVVVFKGNPPRSEWYRFLNTVLYVAQRYCRATELFIVGGMIYLGAHTTPRELLTTANSQKMKKVLAQFGAARDVDFETPPGQRPTLNTYLSWVAKKRNLAAASLWVPVPFYLVSSQDPQAWRKAVEFLDARFNWGLDLGDLDDAVAKQEEKIAEARRHYREIEDPIRKLENNLPLTEHEQEELVKTIEEVLKRRF